MDIKVLPPGKLLLATVASITLFDPWEDLENARFAGQLATKCEITPNEIPLVIVAIEQKMIEYGHKSDGSDSVELICTELAVARTGAQAQFDAFKKIFHSTDKIPHLIIATSDSDTSVDINDGRYPAA